MTPEQSVGRLVTQLDLSNWSIWAENCPCCGGQVDYEEGWGGMTGWWHATATECTWHPDNDATPCPTWPHPTTQEGP